MTTPRRAPAGVALGLLALAACAGSQTPGLPGPSPTPTATATPTPTPSACGSGAIVGGAPALAAALVTSGLDRPVDLASASGDCRVFVVEQAGRIRTIRDGALLPAPFLDITDRVLAGGERGLLGLAFHPRFATNGLFYVNYTDQSGNTHIAEFRASPPSSDHADPGSEREVIFVTQPFANHNGGGLAFGNDGYLYIALGDGGNEGDPLGNGQNLGTMLGKILRIDVDGGTPYAVPSDNPFLNRPGALRAIWAYGLRNPWRIAFDRATGDLFIGDVGQDRMEEIDLDAAPHRGGENYGWNVMEGSLCYQPMAGCDRTGLTLPIQEYDHNQGCAVTGGVVYRGRRMPGYHGTYFYSDYCTGFVRSFEVASGAAANRRDWTGTLGATFESVVSFGTDSDGEPYIVDHNGNVYEIVPAM